MKIPGKATISNRTSTMASQFARARAPYMIPTQAQIVARYVALGIDPSKPTCAYCGGPPSEWDHLFPMVRQSRWTGYFTQIANLIPACGKCNQSRGSKDVTSWMRSAAPWAPLRIFRSRDGMSGTEALTEIDRRISIIETTVAADAPTCLPILDDPLELELEECRLELNALLHRAETIAAKLRLRYQSIVPNG